ncbi:hypothetical protein [Pyxidicoccus sp. MSG2]|uniref:hypothetical protein n=1 Tax=Pyxidicoccus sp. MSG2 TaxID=2996790 RepID=UPI0022721947|nr:hypothetical protein [Pyxidicoccus sp. MSG2]MCY1023435.1 hypothetical protein [Pyxidicoccus sp. MSG2]
MARTQRFGGALVVLTLGGMACHSTRAQGPLPQSPPQPEQPSTPDSELSKSFQELEQQLTKRRQGLSESMSAGLQGGCRGTTAYTRRSVEKTYKEIQAEVLQKVSDPAAAPLRELLEKEFPPLPEAKITECFGATRVYERDDVSSLWTKLAEFFGFAARAANPMTVTVSTIPAEATAQVYPTASVNLPAPKWTECSFDRLYRGVYRMKVSKDGYKPFDQELGVLAADAVTVHCVLAAEDTREPSRCAVKE